MAAKDYINRDLFHASDLPEEEFMKAPAIHVGTYEQSAKIADLITDVTPEQRKDINEGFMRPEEVYEHKIHSTPISEHAKVYPVTLTDKQANRVHSRFLSQRGIKTPPSVTGSTLGYSGNRNFAESSLIEDRALAAMNRNEVIRYVNTIETPDDESDPHSFLVPSPVINMSQMTQRALPMDYSRIVESTVTKYMKNKHGYKDFDEAKEVAKSKQNAKVTRQQRAKRMEENRRKMELKNATNTGSLIDPDVVWPDPQLPDMWKY